MEKKTSRMLFRNILVPTDLSAPSTRAFKVALDLATKYNSKITLLTCVEGDAWHHKFYDARADDELVKKQSKAAKQYLEKMESLAEKNNISVKSYILRSKSVVKDIVVFARSRKHDMIVMGTHGRTGLDKVILGSTANGVAQKTPCPILLVK